MKRCALFVLVAFFPLALPASEPWDVTRYELVIRPDIASRTLSLRAEVSIDNPEKHGQFSFGLNKRYGTVDVRDGSRTAKYILGDGVITVCAEPKTNVHLSFSLAGALGDSGDDPRPVIDDSTVYLLWSDRFYPITFDDWAPMKITIFLPPDFDVIAPGVLVSRREQGELVEHVFEASRPTVCASVIAHRGWRRTEFASGPVKITTLLDAESEKHAGELARTSAEVIATYSDLYGGYPFDDFTFITIPGIYARRAFPGFIGYSPQYLDKEMARTGHDAHETALLWWGYTLRGSGSRSFQWTEGFGDYAELIYDERFGKPIPHNFERFRAAYLARPNGTDPHYSQVQGKQQEIVHGRYPWLMHVMRYRLGDQSFNRAMRLLFTRYRHRTFTMGEFLMTLQEGAGQSLAWWRDEWLERRGTPDWKATTSVRKDGDGWVTTVSIEQAGDVYHLPVEVELAGERRQIQKLEVADVTARAEFRTDFEPKRVTIDPKGWILMRLKVDAADE